MKMLKSSLATAIQTAFGAASENEIINQCGGPTTFPGQWDFSPAAMADIIAVLGGNAAAENAAIELRDLLFRGASSRPTLTEFTFATGVLLSSVLGTTPKNDLQTALFGLPRKKSYLWRNFATAGARMGEVEVYVPHEIYVDGSSNKTVRYAVFSFQPYVNNVTHLGRLKEGAAALNVWHNAGGGAVTKTGFGSTYSPARTVLIPGPNSTVWSESTADEIKFNAVTGHTLVLRFYTNTNGGFAFVALDGSYTSASLKLPAVQSGDLKAISNVYNPNAPSAGPIRITANGHGLTSGRMLIEGVTGGVPANGYQIVSVLDGSTLDLVGPTFSGSYTGGGTIGYFGAADVGKRYVSMYASQAAWYDEHALLAEGITDGAHSVWLKPTGTSHGGAGNCRAYVTGVAGVTHSLTPNQTADHSMVYLRELCNPRNSSSAMVSAIEFNSSGNFLGEVHGYESEAGFAWYVDGRPVWLGLGGYASGTVIRAALRSVLHDQGYISAVADKTSDYFFSAYQRDACRVVSNVAWRAAGTGWSVYYGMLPIGKRNRRTSANPIYVNDEFDNIYFGSTSVSGLGDNNDGWEQDFNNVDKATFYHSTTAHPTRGRLRIDQAKNVNNWAAAGATIHFASWDRIDGMDKVYAARTYPIAEEAYEVGDVHQSDTGFHVFRQTNTSADQEQDA